MQTFFEYIAQSRKMTLPDTHTMLSMAGVSLDVPNGEETERLLKRAKKRPIAPQSDGSRKATRPSPSNGLKPPAG